MAYLVLLFDGHEVHRQELDRTITLGRSPECDVSVRDIQLSRHHCRIEMSLDGWVIEDLNSKNGTSQQGRRVCRKRLVDGDELRMGRTLIRFFDAEFVRLKSSGAPLPKRLERPLDPMEAMAGTVSAFEYVEPATATVTSGGNAAEMPSLAPRPRPADPKIYAREDLYSMISAIASSSWDSIYAQASRPIQMEKLPRPIVKPKAPPTPRVRAPSAQSAQTEVHARARAAMKQEMHMTLQAHPEPATTESVTVASLPAQEERPTTPVPSKRQRRRMWVAAATIWLGAACAAAYSLLG